MMRHQTPQATDVGICIFAKFGVQFISDMGKMLNFFRCGQHSFVICPKQRCFA